VTMSTKAGLIGREAERQAIVRAQKQGIAGIVITGPAGVGKSALAYDAIEALKARHALVGECKHGTGETGASPLLGAVRQLVEAALEELYEPNVGLEQLRASMGPAKNLFDQIVLSRTAGHGVFKDADAIAEQLAYVLDLVFKWLSGFGLPIILLIDDWDRASTEVGKLYARLPSMAADGKLCLIATGRSWPDFANKAALKALALDLDGLSATAKLELLSAALGRDAAKAIITHIPDSATRPLDLLRRAEAIAHQLALGNEIAAPETIAAALSDDLAGVIAASLARLSDDARDIIGLASILGDTTDVEILACAVGQSPTALASAINSLTEARMLVPADESLRFPHDTVRAVISEIVAIGVFREKAIAAAKRLHARPNLNQKLQTALETLLLAFPPQAADRAWTPALLPGIQQSIRLLDIDRASHLASLAMAMDGGLDQARSEVLKPYATTAMVGGKFDIAEKVAVQLRKLAQTRAELSFAYSLSATAARALGKKVDAIKWSLKGHQRLGWNIPEKPSQLSLLTSFIWTNIAGDVLRALPFPTKPPDLPIVELSATTATIFFEYGTPHVVSVARRFALAPETRRTSGGLSAALFMANFLGRHRLAGQLGRQILADGMSAEPNYPPSAYRANFFGRLWTEPAKDFALEHDRLHALALADGDLLVATWALRNKAHLFWRAGANLAEVGHLAETAREFAERVGNATSAAAASQIALAVRLLQGVGSETDIKIEPYCPHTLETPLITWLSFYNFRGEFDKTLEILAKVPRKPSMSLRSHAGVRDVRFHRAVAMLAATGQFFPEDFRGVAEAVKLCPNDNRARLMILRALRAKARGKLPQAYREMVAGCQKAAELERLPDVTLANILAADLARALSKFDAEANHLDKARRAWIAWGADPRAHPRFASFDNAKETTDIQALNLRLEQSERESRAKSRLLALVGHELRTPLQAISGAVELLHAEAGGAEDLSIITASIDRLSTMVDDLSAVTALEAGELAINARPFHLATLLQNLTDTHAAPLHAARMTFSLDAPQDNQIWLLGDDKRLQQILDNLLNNARKYGAGEVELKASNTLDQWFFEVSDQGPGLLPEQAVKIFEPFVRGASVGAVPGHGIGLWLARKLAENMGGELALMTNETGQRGARFRVQVPLKLAAPPELKRTNRQTDPKNLVLIEDEPFSRTVMARLLALDGHSVQVFATGNAAIENLELSQNPPDYVIVDGNMPGLNGLETSQNLRSLPTFANTPIALITAQVTDAHIAAEQRGDISIVLQKPLSLETVRMLLGETNTGVPARPGAMDPRNQQQLAAYIQALIDDYQQRSWQSLEAGAHKLAGAALTLRLQSLGDLALELEHHANLHDELAASKTIKDIEGAFPP